MVEDNSPPFMDKRYEDVLNNFVVSVESALRSVTITCQEPSQDSALLLSYALECLIKGVIAIGNELGFSRAAILAGVCLAIEVLESQSVEAVVESRRRTANCTTVQEMDQEALRVLREYVEGLVLVEGK